MRLAHYWLLLAIALLGLTRCSQSPPEQVDKQPVKEAKMSETLREPIGIVTLADAFTEIIPAGSELPHTFSETFANAADNQPGITITLAQKQPSGTEKIAAVTIDNLPKRPQGMLHVVVTIKVSRKKELTLKATVSETGYVKEFGPFPVE